MKLTRKKAIELCIELWTWCAETGRVKRNWPRWKEFMTKEEADDCNHCWFCFYDNTKSGNCTHCPLGAIYSHCNLKYGKCEFYHWMQAITTGQRKKYAKLFLEQIKSLRT